MKWNKKRFLTVCACLMLGGAALFIAGSLAGGMPGFIYRGNSLLSAHAFDEAFVQKKTKLEPFKNIRLQAKSWADVEILPSEDSSFYIEYSLMGDSREPDFQVKNDTLTFSQKETNAVFSFDFSFFSLENTEPKIRLYIPETASLKKAALDTEGDIFIEKLSADSLELYSRDGDVTIRQAAFKNTLKASISCGDFLGDTITADKLEVSCDDGDMDFSHIESAVSVVSASDGDISFQEEKPGILNCTSRCGDILLKPAGDFSQYYFDLKTTDGELLLPENSANMGLLSVNDDKAVYTSQEKGKYKITAICQDGDICVK